MSAAPVACALRPAPRLRGRSRFGAAKARRGVATRQAKSAGITFFAGIFCGWLRAALLLRVPTLLCLRLATRVPRAGRQARSRPERAEDAARPEDCHPGRAHLRDPGPRNAGEGSVLGPGSPKLRTRNFSGRDDKRWNAHAPTDSLLGAWRHASRAPAAKRGAGRNARVMQRDRRIVIPGEPTCETRDPGTQAKEVYWVPALQNCARAISPAGMTNDGMPTRQPTLCLALGDTRPARRPPSAEPAGTRE